MNRALAVGEDVVAIIRAGRPGAHALPSRRRNPALSAWVAVMSRGAAVRKPDGLAVPARCWIALTDRCAVVVSCDSRERQLDRRVSFRRITHVDTARRDGRPVVRVGLLDGERLVVEVMPESEHELAEFVTQLRAVAGGCSVAMA